MDLEDLIKEIENAKPEETKRMGFSLNLGQIQQSELKANYDKELLPEGIYAAHIKDCKVEISKNGQPYFAFTFRIDFENGWSQNPFNGRQCWETLMIDHPSQTVMDISQKTMADILVACGADTSLEIHDLETEFPLHVVEKQIYVMLNHKWDKMKLEYRPHITAYWGRGEFEGRHRYDQSVPPPTPDLCVNGNQELCQKAIEERDKKVAKAELMAKKAVNTPSGGYPTGGYTGGYTQPTQQLSGQKGIGLGTGIGVTITDVPF